MPRFPHRCRGRRGAGARSTSTRRSTSRCRRRRPARQELRGMHPMKRIIVIIAGFLLFVPLTLAGVAQAAPATATAAGPGTTQPDMVTQWNLAMIAGLEAAGIPPPPAARIGAIVQASVFDAVNGIARQYAPYHVPPAAPPGASRDAAAAGAADTALTALIPAQKALFDAQLAATLAQLSDDPAHPGPSVRRGLAWGATV